MSLSDSFTFSIIFLSSLSLSTSPGLQFGFQPFLVVLCFCRVADICNRKPVPHCVSTCSQVCVLHIEVNINLLKELRSQKVSEACKLLGRQCLHPSVCYQGHLNVWFLLLGFCFPFVWFELVAECSLFWSVFNFFFLLEEKWVDTRWWTVFEKHQNGAMLHDMLTFYFLTWLRKE